MDVMRIGAMNQENITVHHLGLTAIPCYISTGTLCVGRALYGKNCCGTQSGFPPCGRTHDEAEQRGHQRHPLFAVWISVLQHSLLHLHVCPLKQWAPTQLPVKTQCGQAVLEPLQQLGALCDAPASDTTVSQGSETPLNNCYSHVLPLLRK